MKAADVMTRHVISVRPDCEVVAAAQLMLQNRISGLPVVDDRGKLVGIVTEGDMLRRRETRTERRRPRWLEFLISPGRLASEYVQTHGRKICEIMTADPQTITEETPLDEIVLLMEKRRIKRLPVLRGDAMVGIVSRANLVWALASFAPEARDTNPSDASIRERILNEIETQPWTPKTMTSVIVRDGIVELWGTVLDDRERHALRVAAENVPGVKEVKDHLVWVEPVSGMAFDASGKKHAQTTCSPER
jgi:CBS domain-containing protein